MLSRASRAFLLSLPLCVWLTRSPFAVQHLSKSLAQAAAPAKGLVGRTSWSPSATTPPSFSVPPSTMSVDPPPMHRNLRHPHDRFAPPCFARRASPLGHCSLPLFLHFLPALVSTSSLLRSPPPSSPAPALENEVNTATISPLGLSSFALQTLNPAPLICPHLSSFESHCRCSLARMTFPESMKVVESREMAERNGRGTAAAGERFWEGIAGELRVWEGGAHSKVPRYGS